MTVGAVQLYNQANAFVLQDANPQWDDATANLYMFLLAKNTYTPSDAHTAVSDLGIADTDWIETGDGSPIVVPSRAIANVSGNAEFRGGDANFGAAVSISAKYLICVQPADFGGSGIQATDDLLFWVNLRTEDGAEVSSTSSDFVVQAPDVGGQSVWWRTLVQS